MTAKIISVTMQKGGVGKTTTAQNIGIELARRGKRVLLVDIDPQANLTIGLGVDLGEKVALEKAEEKIPENSILEVLLNTELDPSFAIMPLREICETLFLLPARFDLALAELELAGQIGREFLLRDALTHVIDQYDYIIIDSPPTLGLFALNALMAGNTLIVPVQTHVYAYKSLPVLEAILKRIKKHNPTLSIAGILLTMYDSRTTLSQLITLRVREEYEQLVFDTVIPLNTHLAESPVSGKGISAYSPKAAGARAYKKLIDEIERRYEKR
jgi:chromosome partitioning protein